MSMVSDASEILHKLLEGGHSTVAGRLAAAFRNIGKNVVADNIIEAMRAAGYTITEKDPFKEKKGLILSFDRSIQIIHIYAYENDIKHR